MGCMSTVQSKEAVELVPVLLAEADLEAEPVSLEHLQESGQWHAVEQVPCVLEQNLFDVRGFSDLALGPLTANNHHFPTTTRVSCRGVMV